MKKLGWTLCMAAMGYTVFLTASRGGLIVLAVSILIGLWEFGIKGGRRHLLVIGAAIAIGVVAIAPTRLMEMRLAAFENPSASGSAYASFQKRRGLLLTSLRVSAEHPLFGVGPGNFQIISGDWHVAHDSLTELSAEGGIVALVLFLLMVKISFSNVREAGRCESDRGELSLWCSGLKVAMITLVVGCLFSSVEYQFFPYMLMMYTGVLHRIASEARDGQSHECSSEPVLGRNYPFRAPGNAGAVANFGSG